jgi:crossover junction endodeoxyribonuclease RuvC
MKFVGLDLSLTASGIALVDTTPPERHVDVIKMPARYRGADRLHRILVDIARRVSKWAPDLVLIEGYAFGRHNRAHQLGELGGVVRLWLYEKRIPYLEIPPSKLKGYAAGRGNASKDEVFGETIRRLGYQGHDNNEADALWLATMALDHYAGAAVQLDRDGDLVPTDLPKVHRKWLTDVPWPALDRAGSTA